MIFQYKSNLTGNISVLQLYGELIDKEQPKSMIEEVEKMIANGTNKFLLNLQNLKYINSSGLNVLINILTKSRKAGGDVAICHINEKNKELLIITKLDSIFNVCDTVEEAITILNK